VYIVNSSIGVGNIMAAETKTTYDMEGVDAKKVCEHAKY
jgi:hypothetical protein